MSDRTDGTSSGMHVRIYVLTALAVVILAAVMSWMGYGQDIEFQAERVAALAAEMRRGPGIYRIYTTVCAGYGYASPLFYGDLFLYPAAAAVALGVPLGIAFRVLLASIVLLAFLSMYGCVKAVWGQEQAFFTAYMYAFSPVVITDVFIRYAVGTGLAYIFLPMVLLGFYRIVIEPQNRRHDWIILSLGMSGLILSHIISTVLTVILLILLCIICFRRILVQKSTIGYLALAALLTVGLTAFFTFPLLEQMLSSDFRVSGQSNNLAYTAPWYGLFFGSEYVNLLNALIERVAGEEARFVVDWFPGAFGYLLFFVAAVRMRRGRKVKCRTLDLCIVLGVCYLALSIVPQIQPLVQPVLSIIQIPWRNLMFYTVFLALAAGMLMERLSSNGNRRLVRAGMLMATAGTLLVFVGLAMDTLHNGMFPYQELSSSSIGLGEYLPANVPSYDYSVLRGDEVSCSDRNLQYEFYRGDGCSVLVCGQTAEETVFEVPVYMYLGYAVEDEEQGIRFTPGESESGLVEFTVPQGYAGTISIYYEGTALQRMSVAISLLTLAGLAVASGAQTKRLFANHNPICYNGKQ